MHFSLVRFQPDGPPYHGFDDVILPMFHGLARLGYEVETRVNSINHDSVNILFGTCVLPGLLDEYFPANSIIFNLEQLTTASPWRNDRYLDHLARFTVWDYSRRNARFLRRDLGLADVAEIRVGYVPEMTRLVRDFPRDIDVLFYGGLNRRREDALAALRNEGLNVAILSGVYGSGRDHAIARSRCVVNVHYYTPATLEIPRLGYLWANRRAVVSERRKETEIDPGLEECCRFCSYEDLTEAVCEIARSRTARETQEERAFAAFSRLRQEDFLEPVVGRRMHGGAGRPLPGRLHAGSGKDFRADCLNIDINPAMNPDLALDLSLPLDPSVPHHTVRFGEIRLRPGMFSRITAFEVLEHVADLPRTMLNFLTLLEDGGELHLSVPYDLSHGAWQDPTHVRVFNEKSWLYYTSWAWYVGWRDERFELADMAFVLSEYGCSLKAGGTAQEELLRMPRAVDTMRVVLRKRASTRDERAEFDALTRSFYRGAVGEWLVRGAGE